MDTLDSLNAELSDWRRAYNQVKEQYDGLLEVHRSIKDKLYVEKLECAHAQVSNSIAMAWIADIKAAVGCEHMDMPQLVEYLKTMKLENTDEH